MTAPNPWPDLPYSAWSDTCTTLQMCLQIVGKIRMELTPPLNQCWNVTLYPTVWGLTTGLMPYGARMLQIDFDFIEHALMVETSDGERRNIALQPRTVSAFYRRLMSDLEALGMPVKIYTVPSEVADPIPFDQDEVHQSYDPVYANRFWQVLLQTTRVFGVFRGRFIGKVSPIHLFWGAMDLACTRFSGRTAPPHKSMPGLPDRVTRDAYSHEVSSCGFWPGAPGIDPFFYSYTLIPSRPAIARRRSFQKEHPSTPTWANLFSPTKSCAHCPTPTPLCFNFCRAHTKRPRTAPSGTAPHPAA